MYFSALVLWEFFSSGQYDIVSHPLASEVFWQLGTRAGAQMGYEKRFLDVWQEKDR
jgi:hypothetical protein